MSHIGYGDLTPENFPPFAEMLATDGHIYNYWRAHWPRPDVMIPKIEMISRLFSEGALDRRRKEYIAVAVSGRVRSTYCATAHIAILKAMGVRDADLDQLAVDHTALDLTESNRAMLDFAIRMTDAPGTMTRSDVDGLRKVGFTDPQFFEIIFMAGLMNMAGRISQVIGAVPDQRETIEHAPVFRG